FGITMVPALVDTVGFHGDPKVPRHRHEHRCEENTPGTLYETHKHPTLRAEPTFGLTPATLYLPKM
ncbi:MAG TPA: hypothetical protein VNH18_23775, partial [Bryobacteraceae bacterium]|nr:hypothetical protein [Bryobacteraceae bacterium]